MIFIFSSQNNTIFPLFYFDFLEFNFIPIILSRRCLGRISVSRLIIASWSRLHERNFYRGTDTRIMSAVSHMWDKSVVTLLLRRVVSEHSISNGRGDSGKMRTRSCVFLKFCPPTRPRARLRCAHDTDSSALVKAPVPRPYSRFLPQTERPNGRKNDRSDDERLCMNDWAAPRISCILP